MYNFTVTGIQTVSNYFGKARAEVTQIVNKGIGYYGERLVEQVKLNASGAPGPKIITGRYRDSIRGSFHMSGVDGRAEAYTDEEYGHRLEYGGISRTQNKNLLTQPYPHFRPALTTVGKEFIDYLTRTITRL
jgi:hypothetical protein